MGGGPLYLRCKLGHGGKNSFDALENSKEVMSERVLIPYSTINKFSKSEVIIETNGKTHHLTEEYIILVTTCTRY